MNIKQVVFFALTFLCISTTFASSQVEKHKLEKAVIDSAVRNFKSPTSQNKANYEKAIKELLAAVDKRAIEINESLKINSH